VPISFKFLIDPGAAGSGTYPGRGRPPTAFKWAV
jgi:hypothetical protein